MSDPISPEHYKNWSNGAEVWDIVEHLRYNRGAAIKYLARAGRKDPSKEIEDLQKAEAHVRREIELLRST